MPEYRSAPSVIIGFVAHFCPFVPNLAHRCGPLQASVQSFVSVVHPVRSSIMRLERVCLWLIVASEASSAYGAPVLKEVKRKLSLPKLLSRKSSHMDLKGGSNELKPAQRDATEAIEQNDKPQSVSPGAELDEFVFMREWKPIKEPQTIDDPENLEPHWTHGKYSMIQSFQSSKPLMT